MEKQQAGWKEWQKGNQWEYTEDSEERISDSIADFSRLHPPGLDGSSGAASAEAERNGAPVDPDGESHIRPGSPIREAEGRARNLLISKMAGISWLDTPVPNVHFPDLDRSAISYFREKARYRGLLSERNLSTEDPDLLDRLGLVVEGNVTRTGVLLFHPSPEDIIMGSFSKIGMFDGPEVLHQDTVGGPLVKRLDTILEILDLKYFVKPVRYEGWVRMETPPYPAGSLRECLVNALVHNDYSSLNPIQIRVWSNRMMISDSGGLPNNWTVEDLLADHRSEPVNPNLARVFFMMGFIENWGRGIEKVLAGYENTEGKSASFDAASTYFVVKLDALYPVPCASAPRPRPAMRKEERDALILKFMDVPEGRSLREIADMLGVSSTASLSRNHVRPLIDRGFAEYTDAGNPYSRGQMYRTTEAGREYAESLGNGTADAEQELGKPIRE